MKNILFVTDTVLNAKSGAGINGAMHYMMVNSFENAIIYNLFITDEDVTEDKNNFRVNASRFWAKIGAVLRGNPPYLNTMAIKTVKRIIRDKNISIVYVDNSISGQLIKNLKKRYNNVRYICFFHDIEAVKMKFDTNISVFRRMALPIFVRNELLTVKYADKTIVLNDRDNLLYYEQYGKNADAIVPICVPHAKTNLSDKIHYAGTKIQIMFVGVDYGPNINGIRWFLKNVLPLIKCEFEFVIVGYGLEKYKKEFEDNKSPVQVLGTVESLKEYYFDADIVVAPIFEGGGMKVKTAEAFSYGKTMIGSVESLIGYWESIPETLKDNRIFRTESPQVFAEIINDLYQKTFKKNDLEIYEWSKTLYSWDANFDKYKTIFEIGEK